MAAQRCSEFAERGLNPTDTLFQIDTGYESFGIVSRNDKVVEAPSFVSWTVGKAIENVLEHLYVCHNAKITRIRPGEPKRILHGLSIQTQDHPR